MKMENLYNKEGVQIIKNTIYKEGNILILLYIIVENKIA